MENSNNIGKIFKEKLSHLDKSPSDALWSSIEKDLDKKKKRRLLFWIFPSILLLGITTTLIINLSNSDLKTNSKSDKKPSASIKNTSSDELSNTNKTIKNKSTTENQISTISNSESEFKSNLKSNSTVISSKKNTYLNSKKSTLERAINKSKKTISPSNKPEKYKKSKKNQMVIKSNKTKFSDKKNRLTKTISINRKRKSSKINNKKYSNQTTILLTEDSKLQSINKKEVELKNSITQIVESKIDTTKTTISNKKIVALKKKKEQKENDTLPKLDSIKTLKNEIYITPYYGFNYYGKLGNGNSLSSQYKGFKNNGKVKTDFGFYVRWMYSDNVGLRVGVGKTTVSNTINITKINNDIIDISSIKLTPSLTENGINSLFINNSQVLLTQESCYYEIPLEGYYIFSNKKIGMATAFGLSYYYLKENSITLQSSSVSEFEIGGSKRINPVSLSGNLNLVFFYKINKTFSFDVSPSFKYQFLGYKDVNGANLYLLSLRAGISYRL